MKTHIIILASGIGTRSKLKFPKQLYKLGNKSIVRISVEKFIESKISNSIFVTLPENSKWAEDIINDLSGLDVNFVIGGDTRMKSIDNVLIDDSKFNDSDIIITHDSVRCNFDENGIEELISTTKDFGFSSYGNKIHYTIANNLKNEIANRDEYSEIQTPQSMKYYLYKKAKDIISPENFNKATCVLTLAEAHNIPFKFIYGNKNNIKVTENKDFKMLEAVYEK